jgi:hypothetical protein
VIFTDVRWATKITESLLQFSLELYQIHMS